MHARIPVIKYVNGRSCLALLTPAFFAPHRIDNRCPRHTVLNFGLACMQPSVYTMQGTARRPGRLQTWQGLDGIVGGGVRAEHVEQVRAAELEVAQQARRELAIQPAAEGLRHSRTFT